MDPATRILNEANPVGLASWIFLLHTADMIDSNKSGPAKRSLRMVLRAVAGRVLLALTLETCMN
jgi:hypothetical protein